MPTIFCKSFAQKFKRIVEIESKIEQMIPQWEEEIAENKFADCDDYDEYDE